MDSKLIQGLLIASCIFLVFAILLTVADIMRYKGLPERAGPAPAARRPTPAVTVPAETPTAEAEMPEEPGPEEAAEGPEEPAAE
ncbi:MAG: hypothetical protein AMK73_04920 [Planctomycetes bacterium SM23_32]|nr:MAG: hypothetical protein AMK73_04920 [Planctomycetes bacterium SM23_32]